MAGILNRKERILDVILTEEGYKQMQLGDVRFVYATFSDKDTIYHHDENNNFLSGNLNFRLEASSNFYDTINPELDLNRGGDYNLNLDDIDILDRLNNLTDQEEKEQNFLTASAVIDSHIADMLDKHILLYTTSSLDKDNLDFVPKTDVNKFFLYNVGDNSAETTVADSVEISNLNLIKNDARFSDKLNFMFLPPVNKDGSPLGSYLSRQETKDKILVKKGIPNFSDNFYQNSINNIDSNLNIPREEFFIDQLKKDSNLVLQVYEKDVDNKTINKLAVLDHGDILFEDSVTRKSSFKRVFSVGKIFNVDKNESDPTLKESDKQTRISTFFSFANIFTIVFEEEK